MRRYDAYAFASAILVITMLAGSANAQYWFQFGARGGSESAQNSGAAVSIQTITPQLVGSGSLGYWVGETLDNGAFLQAGYVIENESGLYPALCTQASGCGSYEQLNAGDAQWFYEYFPAGFNGGFLGAIGPDGSAGANGTMHTYSFYSNGGGNWVFDMDGNVLGNINLGSSFSGGSTPVAFGEVANTTGIGDQLPHVAFTNLSAYKSGGFEPVSQGTAYIGYGVGSSKGLINPYGVHEVGSRVNYFQVGSGLQDPKNGTVLWSLGYHLKINSQYANNSSSEYIAYSKIGISSPSVVQLAQGTRAVFMGWKGTGVGSYSGAQNATSVQMNGNITETAQWQVQYFLNVSSPYGSTYGTGWYAAGSTANYGVYNSTVLTSATSRAVFSDWSNANSKPLGSIALNSPGYINANWNTQYLVSVQSKYGSISGAGWYNENSTATISLTSSPMQINSTTKLAFYQWSNGNTNTTIQERVSGPILLTAQFRNMYLESFQPLNAYGGKISNATLYINGNAINNTFFFGGAQYQVSYAYYKGVKMLSGFNFTVISPGVVSVTLPVYKVSISARDIFGIPVNSTVNLRFSNSSTLTSYTGQNGTVTLENVPYGYVNGTASYFGITEQMNARSGSAANALFVSALDFATFGIVAAIIAASYFLARRRFGKGQVAQQPNL